VKGLSPAVEDALVSQHGKYVCLFFVASDSHAYSLQIKAAMHTELSVPNEDGERKTEAQVMSKVLAKKTKKPMFLQNVGVEHKPYTSCMSTLSAQLDREKTGSTDLRDVLNNQRHEMEELTSQIEESEEKHCELEQKLQALTRLFDQQR
jgi:septal ring factor EnvC (AmiA/AmiB activator)